MAQVTSPVPEIGASNGTEQVDTTNLLQELKNLLNGGLGVDNFSTLLQQITNPPIVNALPGSPVTGQRVRLRVPRTGADSTVAGPLWPLRYNADAAGSYKWEPDGGVAPLTAGPPVGGGFVSGAGSTYEGFATWQVTVPVAGMYTLRAGGAASGDTYLAVQKSGTSITDDWLVARGDVGARVFPSIECAAGTVFYFAHRSPSNGVKGTSAYWLSLVPERVGS